MMSFAQPNIRVLDSHYFGAPQVAAVYLVENHGRYFWIETASALCLPALREGLRQSGLDPEDVFAKTEAILVTHAHLDHAAGAGVLMDLCPGAIFYAHPKAAKHLVDPTKLITAASRVYGAERFHSLYGVVQGISEERVVPCFHGDVRELAGVPVEFLEVRGHASHHHLIHLPGLRTVFSGDAAGVSYPAINKYLRVPFVFPSTSPSDFDAQEAVKALDLLESLNPEVVALTHYGFFSLEALQLARMRRLILLHGTLMSQVEESIRLGTLPVSRLQSQVQNEIQVYLLEEISRDQYPLASTPETGDLHKVTQEITDALHLDVEINAQGLIAAVLRKLKNEGTTRAES